MRFSVTVGAVGEGRDPRGLAELARAVEDSGWDGMFLEDYLVYQGDASRPTYDPWICLAAMAVATERIRIGTTVTPLPRRRPWKVAAEVVALDRLSNGRMILGVGSGDPGDPFLERHSPKVLAEMLNEGLSIIDQLWTGQPVTFRGTHYTLNDAQLTARAVQEPRVPVWVGGNMLVPAVHRRIRRWDGSCAYKRGPEGALEITPEDVRRLRAGRGRDFDVKVSGVDPALFAEAGATWWGRWIPPLPVADTIAIVRQGPPALWTVDNATKSGRDCR
ncbi:LLM class flavin-dependent oxidoreductase [Kribbella shirazensis]|uniref:Alkanesulfonate monooxygenase SsuD/methylene tetrahydromethanopterin reductase-like flavin-dependent oxidoreductase (Luciferase family) n=1 Tax=Kribbella shirazensis TaxID=1105143 RepID=A0A7X5V8U2_9ACTN|nr:LLM class flavin-dependent oxidoreductase [Kribbella shirazensis]NIK56756.1 alkanesulfonate monooxygenase SsuD/methylene tetrahydromethanopterin reductase-like flavin-dependent oxidoreductase (luciferase family) [Kribbella shirazensis]